MISFFRKALSSWLVLGLLGLLMIGFVVTGVTGNDMGSGMTAAGDTLAKVGNQKIGALDVEQRVQGALRQQQQQQQQAGLSMGQFIAGGGYDAVIDQMLTGTALTAFAEDQGIVASPRQVDGEIAAIPAFRGPGGQFDENTMRQLLAQQRITEPQLRADLAADIVRRQVMVPVGAGAQVPVGMVRPYASLLLEAREGLVGIVPSKALAGNAPPTDAELDAYYRRNQGRYIVPERRVLRYAVIGAETVANAAKPGEAEIAAAYKDAGATYAATERRDVTQVIADTEAKARALAAAVAGGKPLATAAAAARLSPIALKGKTRAELADLASPAVATAVFATAEGKVSAPARSDFGWTVARVDRIVRTPGRTLAQAHDEIAAKLAADKAKSALADLAADLDDRIADGASLSELARAKGLTLADSPPVTATGTAPDTAGFAASPDLAPLLKPAFEMDAADRPVVAPITAGERFALLSVARVIPAAAPPLQRVRDRVTADFLVDRGHQRAKAIAESIAARANGGQSLAAAFAAEPAGLGRPVPAGGRRADLGRGGQQVPPPLAMLFSMAPGKAKILEAPGKQGWWVIALTKVTPGDATNVPTLVEATRSQFARFVGEEYVQQFAAAARAQVGVSRNDAAIAQLKGRLAGDQRQ